METFDTIVGWVNHYKRDSWPGWGPMINKAVKEVIDEAKHDKKAAELAEKIKDAKLMLPPEGQTNLDKHYQSIDYNQMFG